MSHHIMTPRRRVSLCPPSLIQAYALFQLVSYLNASSSAATPPPPPPSFDNNTDHLALLSFKSLITDDPSGALASWNSTAHLCSWRGVICGGRRHPQRVAGLALGGQDLVGTLSPSLGNLSFLRSLQLQNNHLGGRIPPELGRLLRLRNLNLSFNSFTGEIPANLSLCAMLGALRLDNNMIAGRLPSELGSLAQLELLVVSGNMITGRVPASLGNLSSLLQLFLGHNQLEGSIPEELGGITGLQHLSLGFNGLSGGVPPSLYNLSSLRTMQVSNNRLVGTLPPDLGCRLPQLRVLLMYKNQFGGHLPSSFPNASRLSMIELNSNNFVGVVPPNLGALQDLSYLHLAENQLEAANWSFLVSLTNCSRLIGLGLYSNKFQGDLPAVITNLSVQLNKLDISGNRISGGIPSDMGKLINLWTLNMAKNLFTGNIPDTLGTLTNLQGLGLYANKLSGEIPSSLGNLTRLSVLYLHDNDLEGRIPTTFGNFQLLQALDLSHNRLSGEIPKEVIDHRSLSLSLNLSYNSFTGSLPTEVGNLKNLQVLDISGNKLSGEIPRSMGNCESLQYLLMKGNSFQGSIPSSLGNMKDLQMIDVSHNRLSGSIPKFFEKLQFLQVLDLSFNDFEGEVPKGGIFRNFSDYSVLGNSKLCGGDQKLHLPRCPNQDSEKKHRPPKVIIIVSILIASAACLFFLFMFTRYRRTLSSRRDSPSLVSLNDVVQHPRISYWELLKATNEFSRENLLGKGSFGSVYKGVLDEGRKLVAVKVLNLQQHGASKSFMAECEALRNVRHRNLVRIITSCSSLDFQGNNFKALVFEFMPNGSLEKWLHPDQECPSRLSNELNFLQRLSIAMDVACALDYLHNHGETPIIHCDLKPSNILLDCDMCAHVGDFGLSRFILGNDKKWSKNLTSSVGIKGSIGYIAPEYGIGSKPYTLGDVYSYGILLLEMFTGKRPTDELFQEDLNLHKYVQTAFPAQVMDVVDPCLLLRDEHGGANERVQDADSIKEKLQECLISVIEVGLVCSKESPEERMEMRDVIKEMSKIKDAFSGPRTN